MAQKNKINYQSMNTKTLLASAKGAVKREKELTAIVLEHLQEIERRKAYCELGISSLFRYCREVLGYSEAESSYRVNATRLVTISPKAKEKINNGELSLTAASKLHGHIKQEQKSGNRSITSKQVDMMVIAAEGKSTRQLEQMLQENSSQQSGTVTKKVELNERLLKKIEKLRQYYGETSELEILEIVIDEKLAEKEKVKERRVSKKKSSNPRYIKRTTKEALHARSGGQCEYISPINGKRCDTRLHLHIDHIKPVVLGGGNELGNLRHLCFAHNQHAAINVLGIEKMESYLRGHHVK